MTDEMTAGSGAEKVGRKGALRMSRGVRRVALQILFVSDAAGRAEDAQADVVSTQAVSDKEVSGGEAAAGKAAAAGAWALRATSDPLLTRLSPQWPLHRMPSVDRALLRLAVWELFETATPAKVVIDEAVELAKAFGTSDSPRYVNGVLDAVWRERRELTGEPEPDRSEREAGGSA